MFVFQEAPAYTVNSQSTASHQRNNQGLNEENDNTEPPAPRCQGARARSGRWLCAQFSAVYVWMQLISDYLYKGLHPSMRFEAFNTLILENSIICFLPNQSMDEDDHSCRENQSSLFETICENRPDQTSPLPAPEKLTRESQDHNISKAEIQKIAQKQQQSSSTGNHSQIDINVLQRPTSASETTSSESNMSETEDTGGGDEAGSKDAHRRLRAILTPEQVQAHKQTIASTSHLGRRYSARSACES